MRTSTKMLSTSSGNGNDRSGDNPRHPVGTNEVEDEFELEGFSADVEEEEEEEVTLEDLESSQAETTPELASELVAKMVESATRSRAAAAATKADILSAISPHTISVLRASRIAVNAVQAAGSEQYVYPITKKVTAKVNLPDLNLSKPAEEVLKSIAGPRVHGSVVKFSSEKFPSQAENQAHIVSQIDRLVAAAKLAVGEAVDTTPLGGWDEITAEVETQAASEISEAGGVSLLLMDQQLQSS